MTTLDDLRKAELKAQAKINVKQQRDNQYTPTIHSKAPTLSPSDLAAVQKRAYTHVLQKQYSELYRQQMEEDPDSFFNKDDTQDKLISEALHQLHLKKTQSSSTHVLLTINAKEEITLELFKQKINKLTKKKWFTDYLIAFEQRGESLSTLGQGLHAHVLFARTIEPARTRKEISSTMKSICDTTISSCLNFKWIKEKDNNTQCLKVINYLLGIKKDSAKCKKVTMDGIFRTQNNLPTLLHPTDSPLVTLLSTLQEHTTSGTTPDTMDDKPLPT